MKEISFIRQNIEKWKSLEKVVDTADSHNPGELADAYTELTTDLSFSRAHYPKSRITIYLNNLSSALHNTLYKNKKEPISRLFTYWTHELPLAMYDGRKDLKYSLIIFIISVAIGIISALKDDGFARLILGNYYVDMTLNNIENGKPLDVYNNSSELRMFVMIVFNNIGISFRMFATGILTGLATGFFIVYNGIMVGTFQTFFFQQGANVGFESMLGIWCHGTLEMSALVLAGAAGFALGNGWIFPGTYSRRHAFKEGAKRGLKILMCTIPVDLTAGFLESFITRHTEFPTFIRLGIILLSFAFIIYYYIILPKRRHNELSAKNQN